MTKNSLKDAIRESRASDASAAKAGWLGITKPAPKTATKKKAVKK